MNRDQNVVDLIYGHPETGEVNVVLTESEPSWIDVETGFSDLDVGKITFLKDGKHFVWISEVDGFRHLYLHKNTGERIGRITEGEWEVTDFHGIDEVSQTAYFSGTIDDTRERHLYKMSVDLDGGMASGSPMRITTESGWHSVNLSSDYAFFIDRFSTAASPPVVSLYTTAGEWQKDLEPNAELKETLSEYDLPDIEFTRVPGADGTALNAYLIRPRDFHPNKAYRLLMHVYGGPGSQLVRNGWGGTRRLWHQMLADEHDILVAVVDNRGTGARGKAFKSITYKKLGVIEAEDQIAAARYLAALPYVDEDHIGIWGWSYGGFMTLMAMLSGEGPELFRLGVSVAPVSDWRQYDTIYTERYMSTPQKNEEGYDLGAPIKYVDRMSDEQMLLLVHGDADDNVHVQNSIQMVDALQAANKQFRFMVYPGRNHGIHGGTTSLHLFTMITEFIVENL
jgi:dipeptidyl-peptidase-4